MIEILFISILERPVAFAVRHAYAAKRHGGLSFGVLEKGEAFASGSYAVIIITDGGNDG